jgi:hypothetical protein
MNKVALNLAILNVTFGIFLTVFALFNIATLEREPKKFESLCLFNNRVCYFVIYYFSDGDKKFFTPAKNKYSLLALSSTIHFVISINLMIKLIEVSLFKNKKCLVIIQLK